MTMGIRPRPTYQKTRDNRRIHLNRDKLPARATYHFSRDEALDNLESIFTQALERSEPAERVA